MGDLLSGVKPPSADGMHIVYVFCVLFVGRRLIYF